MAHAKLSAITVAICSIVTPLIAHAQSPVPVSIDRGPTLPLITSKVSNIGSMVGVRESPVAGNGVDDPVKNTPVQTKTSPVPWVTPINLRQTLDRPRLLTVGAGLDDRDLVLSSLPNDARQNIKRNEGREAWENKREAWEDKREAWEDKRETWEDRQEFQEEKREASEESRELRTDKRERNPGDAYIIVDKAVLLDSAIQIGGVLLSGVSGNFAYDVLKRQFRNSMSPVDDPPKPPNRRDKGKDGNEMDLPRERKKKGQGRRGGVRARGSRK